MTPPRSIVAGIRADLRAALLGARNADGGWGYVALKQSRIEPTCWALLALGSIDGDLDAVDVLTAWPRRNGWLVDLAGAPANHAFNALAALTMLRHAAALSLVQPIVDRLVVAKGLRLGPTEQLLQDNSLQAWSWI